MRCFYTFINQLKSFYYKLLVCYFEHGGKMTIDRHPSLALYSIFMNGYGIRRGISSRATLFLTTEKAKLKYYLTALRRQPNTKQTLSIMSRHKERHIKKQLQSKL